MKELVKIMKTKYILKRLLMAVPVFLGITMLTYYLSSLAGGSPLAMLFAEMPLTDEQIAKITAEYGLDQPVYIQYLNWLKLLLQGNMGVSYRTTEAVSSMIASRIPLTLLLSLSALLVTLIIAYPLGVLAAVRSNSAVDYVASGFSFLAAATPNFFIGLAAIVIFAVNLGWLPTGGVYTRVSDPSLSDMLYHLILPALVLGLHGVGSMIRQIRGSVLEVLNEDYIRTARSKGMPYRRIVTRHIIRNSMIPVVTLIGLNLPALIGGTLVIEQIFSWPGLGTLMMQSMNARDYPVIMGITVVIAVGVLIGNLIVDLIYGLLDPRISYK